MRKAIVACKVFYEEILDLVENEDIDVKFLPQGLHNLSNNRDMKEEIQKIIDELENENNYDYIILGYGFCSGGVEGLEAKNASLVIPFIHDCIPMLLGDKQINDDLNTSDTYYLSRGWIDCGGDTYKQYLFMTDKSQRWIDKFDNYQKQNEEAKIDWYQNEEYRSTKTYNEEMAEYISFECLKSYQSVTLIDNNNLDPIHEEYTKKMYKFTNNLLKKHRGTGIDCHTAKGNLSLLNKLINFEDLEKKEQKDNFLITPPGSKLEMEKHILK
jgi:hypothetical protein